MQWTLPPWVSHRFAACEWLPTPLRSSKAGTTISQSALFYGAGVTKTARIEPRTPEGEIYTSHPFAALAVLDGSDAFDCQYVGNTPTAKGYGSLPLFALRRRS